MELENEAIPLIAFGFAGGIGNTGAVCGAVAGAAMAISLKLGRAGSMEEGFKTFSVIQEFRRRFEEEMGAFTCRDLTGLDLTSNDVQQLMSSDIPQTVCFPAVASAYRLVLELLKENTQVDV